jgi:hypothetical protein
VPERIVTCHACSRQHRFEDVVPRRAECELCGAALHACLNCTFFDRAAYNECREPNAERVVEKETSNFCDFFEPRAADAPRPPAGGSALGDLERLFKK